MEHVSAEMKDFFAVCEILMHEMSPEDFSDKECKLIEHYCLELYVKYGCRRRSQAAINQQLNGRQKSAIDPG